MVYKRNFMQFEVYFVAVETGYALCFPILQLPDAPRLIINWSRTLTKSIGRHLQYPTFSILLCKINNTCDTYINELLQHISILAVRQRLN